MIIGSAWRKKDKDGNQFLSAVIQVPFLGELSFAIFQVKEKKSEKHPDYNIVWSFKRKEATETSNAVANAFGSDEEIPF